MSNFRWLILGMVAAATALNYLDRQTLPVVVGEIKRDIPLTDQQFGHLQSAFLLAYGIMYAVGGRIMDALGTRVGYAFMIIFWSMANFCQGFVSSVLGLGVFRFLLGVGEGGGFPGSAKAVAEWFPARERSFAFGIFNTGSSLGAVIAPPLIAAVVTMSNWRWVFFLTGAVGIVWAVLWLQVCHKPEHIPEAQQPRSKVRWVDLLQYRQVWGLVCAKFLSDSAWFFFIFWLPKYLNDARGLNIKQIGYYAWPVRLGGRWQFYRRLAEWRASAAACQYEHGTESHAGL